MDEEIRAEIAALKARNVAMEAAVRDLQAQLAALKPRSAGETICLKEAAARSGFSRETMRRRLISGQVEGKKLGGRWILKSGEG